LNNQLKHGWKMVKFGDFAQNVAVRVDPAEAKTDIYVGLEHLDPATLHLRHWGHPSDVIGQKLAFKKGDVIFGRRRAYQRKLAVAVFDGICSAHAMVVRAKPGTILPEFLPFFLQSDMFMERAIEISVGSLSPTINWKTLKEQEFPLPPLDEQKRIAEILWAADNVLERFHQASHFTTKIKRKIEEDIFLYKEGDKPIFSQRSWELVKFDDVANIRRGISWTKAQECLDPRNESVGVIRIPNILSTLDLSDLLYLAGIEDGKRIKYSARQGWSIMICSNGNPNRVGNCAYIEEENNLLFASFLIGIHSKVERLIDKFLYRFLNGPYVQHRITNTVQGSTGLRNISLKMLKSIDFKLPPLSVQRNIVGLFDTLDAKKVEIEQHIEHLKKIQGAVMTRALETAYV